MRLISSPILFLCLSSHLSIPVHIFVPRGACGAGGHGGSAHARSIGGCGGGCVAVRRVQIESVINSLVNKIIIKRKKKKKNLHNLEMQHVSSPRSWC